MKLSCKWKRTSTLSFLLFFTWYFLRIFGPCDWMWPKPWNTYLELSVTCAVALIWLMCVCLCRWVIGNSPAKKNFWELCQRVFDQPCCIFFRLRFLVIVRLYYNETSLSLQLCCKQHYLIQMQPQKWHHAGVVFIELVRPSCAVVVSCVHSCAWLWHALYFSCTRGTCWLGRGKYEFSGSAEG